MRTICVAILVAAIAACVVSAAAKQSDAARMGAEMMNPGAGLACLERKCDGQFRVLVYGNSIALHAPKADIGWTNNWGMAASAREKDFAHLVVSGLEAKLGKKADFRIRNLAVLERNFTTNIATVVEISADAAWNPDYVVIAIGENSPNIDKSNADIFQKFLADIARPFANAGAKVVLRSPFWMNASKAECTAGAAADTGCIYVDAGHLGAKSENKAIGLFSHSGVANHPGDLGMRRLADLILAAFAAQCELQTKASASGEESSAVSSCVDGMAFVDPLIGTYGSGSEYGGMMPYTGVPFGSFQMVPMTRLNRVGQLSFNSADDTLIGFILTRQPAIWMGDWGEVRLPIEPAKIDHARYTPYLGQVTAGGRTFEYTATAHAVWLRGNLTNMRLLDGFNANIDDANLGRELPNFRGWRCVRHVKGGMQIGVSLISLEQARRNLAAEIGERTFEEVVAGTKAEWERHFSRIEIDASEDVKTIFYTGLFHALLYPRQIDEQGRYYSAFDDKIHDGTMYNCYSLWDTYRAEHPWLTLIAPERVDGMMQSLLDMYREGGWLPKWPNPGYTGIMVGAPAEIVLEEAMAKGFSGFDHDLAREAIRKNRTVPQKVDLKRRWRDREEYGEYPETRAGLTSYLKRGYVACDETDESVSRTLDFSFADRNKAYTNLWCASVGLFLPRRADGTFDADAEHAYTECRAETAVWCVPHDPEGLASLMGGNAAAVKRLDEFFETLFWKPERGNKSIHGNEPSHHCAYLYNQFGAPEKTQRRVREILARSYSTDRKGFDGNEDCGQMSAWYIFSALGLYPLDPVSGCYEIGSPIVRGAKLHLGAPYAPATLEIRVKNYAPDRWRVGRVTLNGVELKDWRVRHCDLVKGGVLEFDMESCGEN